MFIAPFYVVYYSTFFQENQLFLLRKKVRVPNTNSIPRNMRMSKWFFGTTILEMKRLSNKDG